MYLYDLAEGIFQNDIWWLGGSDSDVEGNWRWSSGSSAFFSYTNWARGEPDNGDGFVDAQDCVALQRVIEANIEYKWSDHRCEATVSYICERRAFMP
jgi:hypothetical protein